MQGRAVLHQTRKCRCDFHLSLKVPRKGRGWVLVGWATGTGLRRVLALAARAPAFKERGAPPQAACFLVNGDKGSPPTHTPSHPCHGPPGPRGSENPGLHPELSRDPAEAAPPRLPAGVCTGPTLLGAHPGRGSVGQGRQRAGCRPWGAGGGPWPRIWAGGTELAQQPSGRRWVAHPEISRHPCGLDQGLSILAHSLRASPREPEQLRSDHQANLNQDPDGTQVCSPWREASTPPTAPHTASKSTQLPPAACSPLNALHPPGPNPP